MKRLLGFLWVMDMGEWISELSLQDLKDELVLPEEYIEDRKEKDIKVKINNLTKTFTLGKGTITAFKDIDLEIRKGEFWCFIGPSGCGKTSLLRVLAGLEEHTSGSLVINRSQYDTPVNAMVFQGNATFPWMNVYQNIAYGLVNRKIPNSRIRLLYMSI